MSKEEVLRGQRRGKMIDVSFSKGGGGGVKIFNAFGGKDH